MRYPEFLKKGDKIVLTALSRGVRKKDVVRKVRYLKAIENLKKEGFKVEVQDHCFKERLGRSARAKVRGKRFNEAYFDKDSKMVFNIAGGDYQYETLSHINYGKIKEMPTRWVQGYSDTTHITFLMPTICDVASVYGPCLGEFANYNLNECARNNLKLLTGETLVQYSYEMYDEVQEKEDPLEDTVYTKKVEWKSLRGEKEVIISGRLIGGCQDVISSLVGTKYDKVKKFINKYKDDGIVWFLETFATDASKFLMDLNQYKRAGYFKHCKGIVFGRPLVYNQEFLNVDYDKAIKSVLGDLNIPILYDADIGHVKPMISLVTGSITTFEYKEGKCKIITELR